MKQSDKIEHSFYEHYHDTSYICSQDRRNEVSLSEKSSKYVLHNDIHKELVVYRIDGGVMDSNDEIRCDYGIYSEDDCLILVELKGSRYGDALKQIANTIELLIKEPKLSVSKLSARVVLSRTPPKTQIRYSDDRRRQKELWTRYHCDLIAKSRIFEEKLSSI